MLVGGGGWSVYPCYVICHSAFGARVCALVSGLGVYCEIIFTRSRVLVFAVFPSCVGGREICFVEELGL